MVTGTSPLPPPPPPAVLPGTRTGRDPARAIKRGPRRIPPEVVAATQRERLLDGLVQTVAEKGYASARITDICLAAGVTRPAFYALFQGKEDAFLAAYRYGTRVVVRRMEAAHAQAPDWPSAVRTGLQALLALLAAVPAFAATAIVEIDAVGPAGRRERQLVLRQFRRFFADAPRPPRPADPRQLVDAVVAGVHGSIHAEVAAGRAARLPELLTDLSFFVLAPFLGPAEAAAQLTVPAKAVGGVAGTAAAPCAVPPSAGRADG